MEAPRFRKTRVVLAAAHLDSNPTNNAKKICARSVNAATCCTISAAPFGAALNHVPPARGRRRSLPWSVRRNGKACPVAVAKLDRAIANAARRPIRANAHAAIVAPAIREVQAAGAKSLPEIAAVLNGRGNATARGGKWCQGSGTFSSCSMRHGFSGLPPAAEAKAMLMKAVAAVKADKAKALDMFNKGEGGFLDRDLYVFCNNISDGISVAIGNPNAKQLLGTDTRGLKDSNGKPFGQELYAAYQKPEGEITEVSGYLFPRPGADKTPVPKVSLATRVGDLGCGVGYYK
jgi:Single Cache domain 2